MGWAWCRPMIHVRPNPTARADTTTAASRSSSAVTVNVCPGSAESGTSRARRDDEGNALSIFEEEERSPGRSGPPRRAKVCGYGTNLSFRVVAAAAPVDEDPQERARHRRQ